MRGDDPMNRLVDQVNKSFKDRDNRIAGIEARVNHLLQDQSMSSADDYYAKAQDRLLQYVNVVVILGYGGFFALWATAASKIPRWALGACGLLIGTSMLIFICQELFVAYTIGSAHQKVGRPNEDGRSRSPAEREAILTAAWAKTTKYWRGGFLAASITGLAGGLLLIAEYALLLF